MFGLNALLGALGALGVLLLAVVLTASLVVRRRRRRHAGVPASLDAVVVPSTTTYWGGGEWPTIVVRSHGRLRNGTAGRRPVEMVSVPVTSPWEPPRAS
jgi:hypothetical protein